MAQAFHRALGLGESNRYIDDVDAQGVALAGIKGLATRQAVQRQRMRSLRSRVSAQRARIHRQEGRNRSQDAEIAALRKAVHRLSGR